MVRFLAVASRRGRLLAFLLLSAALLPTIASAIFDFPAGGNCTTGTVNPGCTQNGACVINNSCWMYGKHNFTSFVLNNSAVITVTPYDNLGYNGTTNQSDEAIGWNGTGVLVLNVTGAVFIESGTVINATGAGYQGGNSTAPQTGRGRGYGTGGGGVGGGGGYGGAGGSAESGNPGGVAYGNLTYGAQDMGSGGGNGNDKGGNGGGAIFINASGAVQINGTLVVDGRPDAGNGGGGGAGGGITIIGTSITILGNLSSKGGAASNAALAAGYYFGGRFGGGWHQPLRQRGFLKKVGLRKR